MVERSGKVAGLRTLDHAVAQALLARYPSATALRAVGWRLGPLAKRHAPRLGARLVDDIRAALAAQTVTVPAEETAGRVIRELAETRPARRPSRPARPGDRADLQRPP